MVKIESKEIEKLSIFKEIITKSIIQEIEGWYGEEGERRVQDGEHMYTCGGFILIFGKTNTIM